MSEMNRAHQGRMAIRAFQVLAHALLLRGRTAWGGNPGRPWSRRCGHSARKYTAGQTLAAGPMGLEGIRPTYMITKPSWKKYCVDTRETIEG